MGSGGAARLEAVPGGAKPASAGWVEVVEGMGIEMTAMNRPHRLGSQNTVDRRREAFGRGFFVTQNMPPYLDPFSTPEPDAAVLPGRPRDYADGRPTVPALVDEVADPSPAYGRTTKASLCASMGIAEYWILNLPERCLEVHLDPVLDATQRPGFRCATMQRLEASEVVTPLSAPRARVSVADLLP